MENQIEIALCRGLIYEMLERYFVQRKLIYSNIISRRIFPNFDFLPVFDGIATIIAFHDKRPVVREETM